MKINVRLKQTTFALAMHKSWRSRNNYSLFISEATSFFVWLLKHVILLIGEMSQCYKRVWARYEPYLESVTPRGVVGGATDTIDK